MRTIWRIGLWMAAAAVGAVLHTAPASAASRFAVATGNWDATSTWSATSGGASGASVPVTGDAVFIGDAATGYGVTIPTGYAATATSVQVGTSAFSTASSLTLAASTASLTVSGGFTINKPSAANTNALNINASTVSVGGNVTLAGTDPQSARLATIVITTGTLNITGNLIFIAGSAGNNVLDMSGGAGTVNLAGAFTATAGTLTAGTTSIFNFNGSAAGQTVPSNVSSIVFKHLYLNNTNAAGATLSGTITNTGVTGAFRVQSGILNNGGFAIFTNTFEVANGARFNLSGTSAMPPFSTKTFGATSTVNYQGGIQTVSVESYGHLILDGGSTKTPASGTINVAGNFTLGAATTYAGNTSNPVVNLSGNFSDGGTFTSGSGAFTFNGGAGQTITGTSSGTTTFTSLTLNNGNGLSLIGTHDVKVSLGATLTNGRITTNANVLNISNGSVISGADATRFVVGNLRKRFSTGTRQFEVGSEAGGVRYAPVSVTLGSVSTPGDFTVSTTAGDHPNIGTSTLDASHSVNRYWTLTNNSVVFTAHASNQIVFTFVNPGDVDQGPPVADPTVFFVSRYNAPNWTEITPTARTGTSTTISGAGITTANIDGAYQIAEIAPLVPTPGSFNAFETSTAAGAITGVIRTKVAGTAFSLDVVVIASGAQQVGFTDAVLVDLLGNNTLGVALDASNCPTSSTTVQTVSPNPTITGGRSTVSFAAVPNSWRDVRVRVRWTTASPTVTSCSTDNFAIRPNVLTSFAVTDTDAQSTGAPGLRALNDVTFGTVFHKAGRPFSVRATAVNAAGAPAMTSNYVGAPTATLTACAGAACTATFGTLTLATTFVAGQLASDVASYNNVGSFAVQLVDSAFASVDASDGSTATERDITSAAIAVGRFVPDHFAVALNTPIFGTACPAGNFTYIGQTFNYTTAPVITVTAQGFANNTTTLYATSWWRITNASLTSKAYTAATGTLDTGGLPGTDPVIVSTGAGAGTLTFGSGLSFTRTTPTVPASPYNADISLAINVIDDDGVAFAGNPARFAAATANNGIGFDPGKSMRFGFVKLGDVFGALNADAPVSIEARYWDGTTFVRNTADQCTTFIPKNFVLSVQQGSVTTTNMKTPTLASDNNIGAVTALVSGLGRVTVLKPAPAITSPGSVRICLDLDAGAGADTSCQAVTPSIRSYLQGRWTAGNYDKDPGATVGFGVFGTQPNNFIFFRENY